MTQFALNVPLRDIQPSNERKKGKKRFHLSRELFFPLKSFHDRMRVKMLQGREKWKKNSQIIRFWLQSRRVFQTTTSEKCAFGKCLQCYGFHVISGSPFFCLARSCIGQEKAGLCSAEKTSLGTVYNASLLFLSTRVSASQKQTSGVFFEGSSFL